MRGSLLVTFNSFDGTGGDNYRVFVNGQIRDLHYTIITNLYSTYLELGDVVEFKYTRPLTANTIFETINIIRRDFTTDNENNDNGIKETFINSISEFTPVSGTSITFTATTIASAYKYYYVIDSNYQLGMSIGSGFDDYVYGAFGKASEINDGYYYFGGKFTTFNGVSSPKIIKLSPDGSVASTALGTGFNFDVYSIAPSIFDTSKIYATGAFTSYNGVTRNRIVRLNESNLTVDTTFNASVFDSSVFEALPLPDNSVILIGVFFLYNNLPVPRGIIKLTGTGALDPTYIPYTGTSSGFDIASPLPGGSGPRDSVLLSDNSLIVTGGFSTFNGSPAQGIIKFDPSGNIDTSFNYQNAFTTISSGITVSCIIESINGGYYVCGHFDTFSGQSINKLCKLTTNGQLDTSFNVGTGFPGNFINVPTSLGEQSDGKLIVAGPITDYNGVSTGGDKIIRLNTDGSIDNTFNGFSISDANLLGLEILSDDSIILFRNSTVWNGITYNKLYKANKDGTSLMV